MTAQLPDGFTDQLVYQDLPTPVDMEFLPDGRILVADQWNAKIRLISGDSSWVVLTIPDVTFEFERGLVGIAVDPNWPTDPYVYAHVTRNNHFIHILRFTATPPYNNPLIPFSLTNEYTILEEIPDAKLIHNGGTLEFGPDSMLYVSAGDDGVECAAQDTTSLDGVILRLDISGLPSSGTGPPAKSLITPSDNPFVTSPNVNMRLIYCYGLRNPWRFSIDEVTGALYIGDVGEVDFEEINEAYGGENFGWPFREGSLVRNPPACSEPGGMGASTYDAPITAYDHMGGSAAINGGILYRPTGGPFDFPPEYTGSLFYSDYLDQFIRVMDKDSTGTWAPKDSVSGQPNGEDWGLLNWFVADWEIGPDGALYYTWQYNGAYQASPGDIRRVIYSDYPVDVPVNLTGPTLRAFPNPVMGSQTVRMQLAGGHGRCTVDVFSVTGQRVRSLDTVDLIDGQVGQFAWDKRNDYGQEVPSGVYFMRARFLSGGPTQGAIPTQRVVLFP